MAYCTEDDLISRYGEAELIQISDLEGAGVIDSVRVADAIAAVDEDIDGALADAGYTTPVVWSRIRSRAEALVRCRLYTADRPDQVQRECDAANAWLDRLAAGEIPVPGYEAEGSAQVGEPQTDAPDIVFDSDTLGDYTRS